MKSAGPNAGEAKNTDEVIRPAAPGLGRRDLMKTIGAGVMMTTLGGGAVAAQETGRACKRGTPSAPPSGVSAITRSGYKNDANRLWGNGPWTARPPDRFLRDFIVGSDPHRRGGRRPAEYRGGFDRRSHRGIRLGTGPHRREDGPDEPERDEMHDRRMGSGHQSGVRGVCQLRHGARDRLQRRRSRRRRPQ